MAEITLKESGLSYLVGCYWDWTNSSLKQSYKDIVLDNLAIAIKKEFAIRNGKH